MTHCCHSFFFFFSFWASIKMGTSFMLRSSSLCCTLPEEMFFLRHSFEKWSNCLWVTHLPFSLLGDLDANLDLLVCRESGLACEPWLYIFSSISIVALSSTRTSWIVINSGFAPEWRLSSYIYIMRLLFEIATTFILASAIASIISVNFASSSMNIRHISFVFFFWFVYVEVLFSFCPHLQITCQFGCSQSVLIKLDRFMLFRGMCFE